MARTFIRQDTQIRSSDVYDDTVAPSLANFETNPTEIEGDLNSIRSMLSHLLDVQVGNWYDVISTPSTLETGTQRGVSDLNDALHLVEKKRVLRCVQLLTDVTVPTAVAASATLTSTGAFTDGESVTITGPGGARTYTFRSPFVDAADNIDASGTVAQTHENLRRAINGDGVAGVNYGTGTAVNADVTATDTPTTNVITAIISGTQGNSITVAETGVNLNWSAATLQNGAGDVVILGTGELPGNTTAAVGAVTTLGTVVATATTFGTAGLDEVAGLHALAPKNLLEVVDGTTGDPILSTEGKRVWGLMQGESGLTDGGTITDTTTTRVQIAFVHANATNDDLILADGADVGGKTINYCYVERTRLEDLTESDFLNSAAIDIGAGAVTPTRQLGYDNQGITPVDLVTNATLDLEGAGLIWAIRDDLEAVLFRIIEGSAGGTSEVEISSDVDLYDNNAIDVDFASGASINSGGTRPIDVGVTDGVIESTAGDLMVKAAAELYFDDLNQTGSTWAQDGIKLSETTAEWDAFETAFGEVSLLNAIVQAANPGNARLTKTYANVTSTTVADTDVGGTGGGANLDAQLPDMSTGTFLQDYDVFLNGALLRPGADATANNDYYPGTSLALGQLKFEFVVKLNDVIAVVAYS